MSVLDAFVHDPLVEWEDVKRKMVKSLVFRSAQSLLIIPLPPGSGTL